MTSNERQYYIESLEILKAQSEQKGYEGEVEALEAAIDALREQEEPSITLAKLEEMKDRIKARLKLCVDKVTKKQFTNWDLVDLSCDIGNIIRRTYNDERFNGDV